MLKQLKIAKALEIKREKLKEIETKATAILKRNEDTQAALTEAKTEDDLTLLENEITNIEKEQSDLDAEKKNVEDEITALEEELEEIKERESQSSKKKQTREKGAIENMNRLQVKELLKTGEYYKRSEVIEFYDKFKNLEQLRVEN